MSNLYSCISNDLPLLSRIQAECELSHIWAIFVDILRMKQPLCQLWWPAEQNGPLRPKQSTWLISLVCWAPRLLLGCFWKILQLTLVINSAGLGATECQTSTNTVWPDQDVTSCSRHSRGLGTIKTENICSVAQHADHRFNDATGDFVFLSGCWNYTPLECFLVQNLKMTSVFSKDTMYTWYYRFNKQFSLLIFTF